MSRFYAHSLPDKEKEYWQALDEHLRGAAGLARQRGDKLGLGDMAALAGLLHDLGKYTPDFQNRLEGGAPVDHATAGAQWAHGAYHKEARLAADMLAYVIAGHHAGLADRHGPDDASLEARLSKSVPTPAAQWQDELGPRPSPTAPAHLRPHPAWPGFQLSMLTRFLFSCLVDADYLDTEAFYARSRGETVDRGCSEGPEDLLSRLETYLDRLKPPDTPVNRLRARVLAHARAQASQPPGLFSLTVPTGGGKTLTSLAFALDHARAHGLDRVIYAIPFTSIIDQTAETFRRALGANVVLEHHASLDEETLSERDGAGKLRRAMEDWDAPVVVTTNVQFFESLFSHRPSRCRKLHNIARSVIILDEAQTIPLHVLRPCVAALDELARNHRCSIVLCTATQPALRADRFKNGLDGVRELAPDPDALQAALARTTIRQGGVMDDRALLAALADRSQGLVIVNSRAHALALFQAARAEGLEGAIHLTTRQVAADRQEILQTIRSALKDGHPCRVIATSLVEAGVDLDFPAVFRAEAGLESILQAAGRCNREGRRPAPDSVVTIFEAPDWPAPRALQAFASATRHVLSQHRDPAALETMTAYFSEVYWRAGPEALDKFNVLGQVSMHGRGTDFAFRTIGETVRLIESGLAPVIIPHHDDACRDALAALPFATRTGALARALQRYTVQIPPRDRDRLVAAGQVTFRDTERQFAVLEDASLYTMDTGLIWEQAGELTPEASVW